MSQHRANPFESELKAFRDHIYMLGAIWILIGVIVGIVGYVLWNFAFTRPDLAPIPAVQYIFLLIPLLLALFFAGIGFLMCMKRIWAVYIGLILCYLAITGFIGLSLDGQSHYMQEILIFVVITFLTHKVIGYAKRLRELGVSL